MKFKAKLSVTTLLVLVFTLVLFYQNCSQEGSSDLFSNAPPITPTNGSNNFGTGVFKVEFKDQANNVVSLQDFIYPEPILVGVNYGANASSAIACAVPLGQEAKCLNFWPRNELTTSLTDCTSTTAKPWIRLDCPHKVVEGWTVVTGGIIDSDLAADADGSNRLPAGTTFVLFIKPNDPSVAAQSTLHSYLFDYKSR